jgi:hypothetical protein
MKGKEGEEWTCARLFFKGKHLQIFVAGGTDMRDRRKRKGTCQGMFPDFHLQ